MVAAPAFRVPPLADIETERAERRLHHFIRQAWPVIEPGTPYLDNWHIHAICDHLEAVLQGEIRNLLINMPPRMMKSIAVSVMLPAWAWIHRPELRFLYASYAQSLATDHSVATRAVIESDWYQERWGDRFRLADDNNLKVKFENDKRGRRYATSVGGSATGHGGDVIVADDPHNVKEAESDTIRQATLAWWDRAMSSRLNDQKTGAKIIVMQRVHENDLSGHVLAQGGYEHLMLPMEYEPTTMVTGIGWRDPRTEEGELLHPDRIGPAEVASLKVALGSYGYAGQYQQRPSPATGGIFKRQWLRFWQCAGEHRPPVVVQTEAGPLAIEPTTLPPDAEAATVQSWDMAFKETEDGSFVVGQVGQLVGSRLFLRDQVRDHLDFPATLGAMLGLIGRWPQTRQKYVEAAANGPAVIQTLGNQVPGLVAVKPDGSKVARAHAVTWAFEAGNVILPHPQLAPWVDGLIEELMVFPNGRHDDQVDALTQMVSRTLGTGAAQVAAVLAGTQSWVSGTGLPAPDADAYVPAGLRRTG